MKRIISILIYLLLISNCVAQKKSTFIKQSKGLDEGTINYVTSKAFENAKINGEADILSIIKSNTIDEIIELLGKPESIKLEQDKANNGTVLFERKLVSYPGLLLVFPKKEQTYKLIRIDFTSGKSALVIDHKKISIGITIGKISDSLIQNSSVMSEGTINIRVSKNQKYKGSHKIKSDTLSFRKELLKIKYNKEYKVEEMSILMYTI